MMGRQVRPPDPWDAVVSVTDEELETAEFDTPNRGRYEIRWQSPDSSFKYGVYLVLGQREIYINPCSTVRGGKRIIRRDRKRRFQGKWQPAGTVVYSEDA